MAQHDRLDFTPLAAAGGHPFLSLAFVFIWNLIIIPGPERSKGSELDCLEFFCRPPAQHARGFGAARQCLAMAASHVRKSSIAAVLRRGFALRRVIDQPAWQSLLHRAVHPGQRLQWISWLLQVVVLPSGNLDPCTQFCPWQFGAILSYAKASESSKFQRVNGQVPEPSLLDL